MLELRINGFFVDTPKGSKLNIRLNRFVTDLADPSARGGDASYTLSIPNTPANSAVLEYRGAKRRADRFKRDSLFTAEVRVDGASVLSGTFRLDEWDQDEFRGTLAAGVNELSTSLQSSLQKLSFEKLAYNGPFSWVGYNLDETFPVQTSETWGGVWYGTTGTVVNGKPWLGTWPLWFPLLVGGEFARIDSAERRSVKLHTNKVSGIATTYASDLPSTAPTDEVRVVQNMGDASNIYLGWSWPRAFKGDQGNWEDKGPARGVIDFRAFRPAVFVKDVLKSIFEPLGLTLQGRILDDEDFQRLSIVAANTEDALNWQYLGRARASFTPFENVQVFKAVAPDGRVVSVVPSNQQRGWARINNTATHDKRPYVGFDGGARMFHFNGDLFDGGTRHFSSNIVNDEMGMLRGDKGDFDDLNPMKYGLLRPLMDTPVLDPSCSLSAWKRPTDGAVSHSAGNAPTVIYTDGFDYGSAGDGVGAEWRCPKDGKYRLTYHVKLDRFSARYTNQASNSGHGYDYWMPSRACVVMTRGDEPDMSRLWSKLKDDARGVDTALYDESILAWQYLFGTNPSPTGASGGTGVQDATLVTAQNSPGGTNFTDGAPDGKRKVTTNHELVLTVDVDLKQGDNVQCQFFLPFENCFLDNSGPDEPFFLTYQEYEVELADDATFNYFEATPLFGDTYLDPAKCLPDMTQAEFLVQLMGMFNQYLQIDKERGTATLANRTEFYRHWAEALDITDSVVLSSLKGKPAGGPRSVTMGFEQWDEDVSFSKDNVPPTLDIEGDNVYAGKAAKVELSFYQTGDKTFETPYPDSAGLKQRIKFPFAATPASWNVRQDDEDLRWPSQPGARFVYAGQYLPDYGRVWAIQGLLAPDSYYCFNDPGRNYFNWPLAEAVNTAPDGFQVYGDLFGQFWRDYQLYAGLELVEVQAYLTPVQWQQMTLERPLKVGQELYLLSQIVGYDPTGVSPSTLYLLRP